MSDVVPTKAKSKVLPSNTAQGNTVEPSAGQAKGSEPKISNVIPTKPGSTKVLPDWRKVRGVPSPSEKDRRGSFAIKTTNGSPVMVEAPKAVLAEFKGWLSAAGRSGETKPDAAAKAPKDRGTAAVPPKAAKGKALPPNAKPCCTTVVSSPTQAAGTPCNTPENSTLVVPSNTTQGSPVVDAPAIMAGLTKGLLSSKASSKSRDGTHAVPPRAASTKVVPSNTQGSTVAVAPALLAGLTKGVLSTAGQGEAKPESTKASNRGTAAVPPKAAKNKAAPSNPKALKRTLALSGGLASLAEESEVVAPAGQQLPSPSNKRSRSLSFSGKATKNAKPPPSGMWIGTPPPAPPKLDANGEIAGQAPANNNNNNGGTNPPEPQSPWNSLGSDFLLSEGGTIKDYVEHRFNLFAWAINGNYKLAQSNETMLRCIVEEGTKTPEKEAQYKEYQLFVEAAAVTQGLARVNADMLRSAMKAPLFPNGAAAKEIDTNNEGEATAS